MQHLRLLRHLLLPFTLLFSALLISGSANAQNCSQAKIIDSSSTCCSYWIANNESGSNENYLQPKHVFDNETDAKDFYQNLHAKMPFYEPFSGNTVRISQGWYYDSNSFHAAIDYVKDDVPNNSDPTFAVRSVADGRVVSVYWDDWFGNTIVIEHQAKDGTLYRSLYLHVRDGKDHDVNLARNISIPSDAANDSNWRKYKRFADKTPLDRHWGTNAQTIKVSVGASVRAGQLIAYSGNTGAGGAGNGLSTDGTPNNATRANNHLHLFMAVRNPKDNNKWLFIDPYGAYSPDTTGCYDLYAKTKYNRFFATHYSNFHDIDSRLLTHYFNYYPKMGRTLKTISFHLKGKDLRASGSFQDLGKQGWLTRFYAKEAAYIRYFREYERRGFRPRELSVTIDTSGRPRYTAIWQSKGNAAWASYHKLSDSEFDAKWNELVQKGGYRIEDHFAYNISGSRKHAVVFVKDNKPFYFVHSMKSSSYNSFFSEVYQKGFRQHSLQVEPGGTVGGVFLRSNNSQPAYYGMSAQDYQNRFDQMSRDGYRLHKIQGYNNSKSFAAIWTK